MEHRKTVPKASVKETGKTTRSGDVLGYACVSTADQDVAAQEDRLRQTGAIRVFVDVISGRQFERPGLSALIDHARPGDSLRVTRLDRLGRSLKELLETVENLKAHDIHLASLEKRIDTVNGTERCPVFGKIRCPIFCTLRNSNPGCYPAAALPSSSFPATLSIPALRLVLSR